MSDLCPQPDPVDDRVPMVAGSQGHSPSPGVDTTPCEPRPIGTSAEASDGGTSSSDPILSGGQLGRYVVLEEVGRGAMGRVWRAYDPKLQREVAIKEVHRQALGRAGADRLIAEARAMAKLSDSRVVAVYDVEPLDDARLALVMEYVRGRTLQTWLSVGNRTAREVIEVFVAAGHGLAAAHQAGLLHRDFKPANVLIGQGGVIKVTDFGLAKPPDDTPSPGSDTGDLDRGEGPLTQSGLVLGTPRYMAPEQHLGRVLTPAVDQYAFCVSLWEALCAAPPFAAGNKLGIRKLAGPPSWPSGRGQRHLSGAVPRSTAEAIRRGLAGEPQDRWPSMAALLEVLARDPGRRWRRRWVTAAGLGIMGLGGAALQAWAGAQAGRCSGAVTALDGAWDGARREKVEVALRRAAAGYGDAAWTRTGTALDAYASAWARQHTQACEATTVRGEQSAAMMDLRMACLARARTDLAAAVDVLAQADEEVVRRAHALIRGLRPLERCEDGPALAAAVEPPLPAEANAVEAVRELLARADAQARAGHFEQARFALTQAQHALGSVRYGPLITELRLTEGQVGEAVGDYAVAEQALREALASGLRWRQWDRVQEAASALMLVVGERQRHTEEGLRYRELALTLAEDSPVRAAGAHNNVARVLYAQGDYDGAQEQAREALALLAGSPEGLAWEGAAAHNILAGVLMARGQFAAAQAELTQGLVARERILGREHPDVAALYNNLAGVFHAQGKLEDAARALATGLQGLEVSLGDDHPHVATARDNLAGIYRAQGSLEQAEQELRQALASRERALGSSHPDVALSRVNLADLLRSRGRFEEAQVLAGEAWVASQGRDVPGPQRAQAAFVLAQALWGPPGPGGEGAEGQGHQALEMGRVAYRGFMDAGEGFTASAAEVAGWLAAHGAAGAPGPAGP